jgi:hypothetical protein
MVRRRDDQRLNRRVPRGPSPADPTGTAGELAPADVPREVNPHADTPGRPEAHGTLPMAHKLTDPATEDEIQALAAEAPLPTVDQAARLARLLRLDRLRRPGRADAA